VTCDWVDAANLDQWHCDTCQYSGKCGGAMWPRHGQPQGTKSTVEVMGSKNVFGGLWVLNT
jgi:hypothetical protein